VARSEDTLPRMIAVRRVVIDMGSVWAVWIVFGVSTFIARKGAGRRV
jgi:hypothetical protein